MSSETVLCEGLKGNGMRAGLAYVPKGAARRTIAGRAFFDSGRTLKDGTRVFEMKEESQMKEESHE